MPNRHGHGHEYAQSPLGKFTTLNGRVVELKTTVGGNSIALHWDDGLCDIFEVDAVDYFIDLFIDAVEHARGTPQNIPQKVLQRPGRRERMLRLIANLRRREATLRAKRERLEERV